MRAMGEVPERRDAFVETRTISLLTQPLTLRGILVYRRPRYIEKRIDAPHTERIVVDGDALTVTDGRGTKRIDIDSHPLIRTYVEAIRATLAGEVAALRRHYHVKLEGTPTEWTLRLRPMDPAAADHVTSLQVSGSGSRIRRVEILEPGGDRSVMAIGGVGP